MTGGDQQNGGTPGWAVPGQGPQDTPSQWQTPHPQQPSQHPQTPYQQQPQQYPQQQYPQWPVRQQPGGGSGISSTGKALIIGAAVFMALAIVAAVLLTGNSSSANNAATTVVPAQSASSAATDDQPSAEPSFTQGPALADCTEASSISSEPVGYHACGTASRDVGVPTYNAAEAKKSYTATIKTNRGDVVFTANGKAAPYTVYSFVYLAQKQYFDNTTCHRLTTSGIYVLQCGDPTATGSGGPGYAFQDENLASLGSKDSSGSVTYKAGVVAMANAGPDTNGSQFFLVYRDSPIAPGYTPFGTITQGLSILQQIAHAGTDNSYGSGDGAPKESVQIESVTIQ